VTVVAGKPLNSATLDQVTGHEGFSF